MEARILPLPTAVPLPPATDLTSGAVRVERERIVIEHLVVEDPALAASLGERDKPNGPRSSSVRCGSACSPSRTPR